MIMTQGVNNLIDAIESGDSMAIDTAFNTELSTRISDKLDVMRQDLAQNMFKEHEVEAEPKVMDDAGAGAMDTANAEALGSTEEVISTDTDETAE